MNYTVCFLSLNKKKMSYLLLFFYLLIFIFLIKKLPFFKSGTLNSNLVVGVFLLKFLAGIAVFMVYSFYYTDRTSADIFKYFDDGNIIFSSIHHNPMDYLRMVTGIGSESPHLMKYYDTCSFWIKPFNYGLYNDNLTVIRFNAIVRLFSMGNIHIHTLFMSFLSFIGLWAIYKVFAKRITGHSYLLLIALFFIPSVWFWTSGILKEGILMFAFGLFFYHLTNLIFEKMKYSSLGWMIFVTLLLLISKFYVFLAALPGVLFLIIIRKTSKRYSTLKFLGVHFILFLLFWFSKPLTGFDLPQVVANKQNDFIAYSKSLNQVGSRIDIEPIAPTLKSIGVNAPKAFFTTLFRPSIFESKNAMMLMAGFENLIITLAIILVLFFGTLKNIRDPLLWFSISFIIILFTLTGLTTPILGALVRYKVPALPFLGITIIYFCNFDTLNSFIKKIKIWPKSH